MDAGQGHRLDYTHLFQVVEGENRRRPALLRKPVLRSTGTILFCSRLAEPDFCNTIKNNRIISFPNDQRLKGMRVGKNVGVAAVVGKRRRPADAGMELAERIGVHDVLEYTPRSARSS